MQFLKRHWLKLFIPLICIVCGLAVLIPYLLHADSLNMTWTEYEMYNVDNCDDKTIDHIVVNQSGNKNSVDFYGHSMYPYFEYALATTDVVNPVNSQYLTFSLNEELTDWHTIRGSGFLFNVNAENNGYLVLFEKDVVNLYYLTGFNNHDGIIGLDLKDEVFTDISEYIMSAEKPEGTIQNVEMQVSANHLKLLDNGEILFDTALDYNTGGALFGAAVQWENHEGCESCSHVSFSKIGCMDNISAPTADFDYNLSIANINQFVFVVNKSVDNNDPSTTLTYSWTVERTVDGATTEVYNSSVMPTGYNQWGTGTYKTTLQVENEYSLYSEVVSKEMEIISEPTITIEADKAEHYSEETISFNVGSWYNCSTSACDVIIEDAVSENLYSPSIELVGSDNITAVSDDLTAEVTFEYIDGTTSTETVIIPKNGETVSDETNKDKQVAKVTVIYKSLPALAEINSDSYLRFSYDTCEPLSNYYVGGGSPRRYEVKSTATITINATTNPTTISASAKTSIIQNMASFSLSGTIDNRNAITLPPNINTEFLLSGFSSGGESISQFVVVTDGESPVVTLPYGEYTLREVAEFAEGYEDINPISLKIDNKGITVDNETVVKNNGKVEFVKQIQITTITIERVYKTNDGIDINSDTDFKVSLNGDPVIEEIDASFELISPSDDEAYYCDKKSTLILPVGVYTIEETQSYRLVSLENIAQNDCSIWNRVLNSETTAETGKASFMSKSGETSAIVLTYISDEYDYDETVYENAIHFASDRVNSQGESVSPKDVDQVLVDPSEYKYPITLVNTVTGEDYRGIVDPEEGIVFNYMIPGKYRIVCSNNMYMNFEQLEIINADNLTFSEKNGEYYLTIHSNRSTGEIEEIETLANWRGYSSVNTSSQLKGQSDNGKVYPTVNSHISLSVIAKDQAGTPVENCEFQIYDKDGDLVYFILKNNKWYPSTNDVENSIAIFHTNEHGKFNFYEFPVGEYTITERSPSDTLYAVTPIQKIIVTGERNMGVYMLFADTEKIEIPTSVELYAAKETISIGETIQISAKIVPSNAYKNITYSTADGAIIDVTEDGIVTGLTVGVGTVVVTSDLDGSVIGFIKITVKDYTDEPEIFNLKLDSASVYLEVGEVYKPNVISAPSNAVLPIFTWTSEDPSIASVSSDGTITAKKQGVTDITVSSGDLSAAIRVTVGQKIVLPTEIYSTDIDSQGMQLIYNHPILSNGQLKVTILPEDTSNPELEFKSSDSSIVAVDEDGNLTAKSAGSVVITAATYNGVSTDCLVNSVSIIDDISFNIDNCSIVKGTSAKLTPSIGPKGSINEDSLVWASSDSSIVSVDQNGKITAKEVGEATISLTSSYPDTEDVTALCVVKVTTDVVNASNLDVCKDTNFETITFTEPIELSMGEETEFYARVRPASTTDPEIVWTFSEEGVVSIVPADETTYDPTDAINKFKVVADGDHGGKVTVTGTVKGTDATTTFVVDVDEKGTGFTIPLPPSSLPNDDISDTDAYKLILGKSSYDEVDIDIKFDNVLSKARNITWTTSDASIANVTFTKDDKSSINVKAAAVGTTTLTANVEFKIGGTYTKAIDIVVEDPKISVYVDGEETSELFVSDEPQLFVVEPNYPTSDNVSYTFSYDETLIGIESNPSGDTDYGKGYRVSATEFGESVPVTITSSDENVTPIEVDVNTGYNISVYIYRHGQLYTTLSQTVEKGTAATFSLPSVACDLSGYSFYGYSTNNTTSKSYSSYQNITISSNLNLYAIFYKSESETTETPVTGSISSTRNSDVKSTSIPGDAYDVIINSSITWAKSSHSYTYDTYVNGDGVRVNTYDGEYEYCTSNYPDSNGTAQTKINGTIQLWATSNQNLSDTKTYSHISSSISLSCRGETSCICTNSNVGTNGGRYTYYGYVGTASMSYSYTKKDTKVTVYYSL